jgi:hypothetical protein
MPSERQLNQAQVIRELQEENAHLLKHVRWLLWAAQRKEGYIQDVLASQQKLIAAIKSVVQDDGSAVSLEIKDLIINPPSSVACEREARLAVLSPADKVVRQRIDDTVRQARSKRLGTSLEDDIREIGKGQRLAGGEE